MKKKAFVFLAVFLIVFIFFLINNRENKNVVCFEKKCFDVELARTLQEQEAGLMFRKELKKSQGMLFVFQTEDFYSFWMKNTFIPLDIIWIDKAGTVVFISKDNKLCAENFCPTIRSDKKAMYVLELNSGVAEENNIFVGKKAEIRLEER